MKTPVLIILALAVGVFGGYYYAVNKLSAPKISEGVSAQDKARMDAVQSIVVGRWQSEEDSNFVREFKADGTTVDYYDEMPEPSETKGVWSLFTSSNPEPVPFPIKANEVYLKMILGNENYHFAVLAVTPEKLELMYMERGNILLFARLK